MALREIGYSGQRPVESYGPGFFRVGTEVLRGPLALGPWGMRAWGGWEDRDFTDVDLMILGCGAELLPLPSGFRADLDARVIGLECMASPAACRVYNLVLAEGRRVGLAAFPMPG